MLTFSYHPTLKKSSETCQGEISHQDYLVPIGLIFFIGWGDQLHTCSPFVTVQPLLPTLEFDRVEESLDYSAVFL